ncbi:hypothetical protein DFH06DRAFT_1340657 [Mycena polygramma]|nr:hypothetical protein DFH06DRAFT_1340657 [Mycena polygramma]
MVSESEPSGEAFHLLRARARYRDSGSLDASTPLPSPASGSGNQRLSSSSGLADTLGRGLLPYRLVPDTAAFVHDRAVAVVALTVGVKVVLSNMILLGSVKIEGGHSFDAPEQYYIPPFSTVAFAMTEHFVQLAGFHGDDHADFRNTVLSTVAHFQYCMVVRPGYLSHPVDAPGFSFDVLDPFEYGVGTHTKATQIAEVNSHGGLAHAFGQNLPRYCPESASEGLVYRFPVCPEEFRFAPTRPNTPIPELVPIVE